MRAKKIENKPILNEIVSDAVEVKRMKKKIGRLMTELKQHKSEIEKYQKMQTELDLLKRYTIQPSDVKSAPRRQTWGGGVQSMIPLHVKNDLPLIVDKTVKNPASYVRGDRGGCDVSQIGCYEDFQDMTIIDENDTESTSSLKNPARVNPFKRSLLATPKSFRNCANGTLFILLL